MGANAESPSQTEPNTLECGAPEPEGETGTKPGARVTNAPSHGTPKSAPSVAGAWRFAGAYGVLFLIMGAAMPYTGAWLESRGVSPAVIGLTASLGLGARLLGSIAGGYWSDRMGNPRIVFQLSAAVTAVAYLAHFPQWEPALLVGLTVLVGAAAAPLTPLMEINAMDASRRRGFSYGRVRSVGSASFVLASIAVGWLADAWSLDAIITWLAAAAALTVFVGGVLPNRIVSDAPAPSAPKPRNPLRTVLGDRRIMLAFFASGFVQASHGFYYWFSTIAWSDAGYSKTAIGALWGWAVIAEIIFLAFFAKRAEALGPAWLIAIGAIAGMVRWTVLAFEPPLAVIALVQTLHAGTFAAAHVGLVLFVSQSVPAHARGTAQAINSGLTFGGVLAFSTLLSGYLYAGIGATGFAAMVVFSLIGGTCAVLLMRMQASTP